jgi:hypothetical protein
MVRLLHPGAKMVRGVVTVKTTKKPNPGRVVSHAPKPLPSRLVRTKNGVKRVYG